AHARDPPGAVPERTRAPLGRADAGEAARAPGHGRLARPDAWGLAGRGLLGDQRGVARERGGDAQEALRPRHRRLWRAGDRRARERAGGRWPGLRRRLRRSHPVRAQGHGLGRRPQLVPHAQREVPGQLRPHHLRARRARRWGPPHRERPDPARPGRLLREKPMKTPFRTALLLLAVTALAASASAAELPNVSYDPTRELYQAYNAAFARYWKQKTGQDVTVQQSHGGT